MTETAAPEVSTEKTENAENAAPEVPVLASLADADQFTQATVPVRNALANALNEIITRNASKTKGVDEIAASLVESSTDSKVVALRAKRDEINEQISKMVLDQAKALKAEAGEPDIDAEKSALEAFRGVEKALATFPDGKRAKPFLVDVLSPNVGRLGTGTTSATGPKNDLSAVREWARKNGFPDVKDRGRMSDEILDAYNKANPSK